MKNKMRKWTALVLGSLLLTSGCDSISRSEERILAEFIFCESLSNTPILLEVDSICNADNQRVIILIAGKSLVDSWSGENVTVCSVKEAETRIQEIVDQYGTGGVQIRIEELKDGCRKVFHRKPRL